VYLTSIFVITKIFGWAGKTSQIGNSSPFAILGLAACFADLYNAKMSESTSIAYAAFSVEIPEIA
jgi:hypothetical protein